MRIQIKVKEIRIQKNMSLAKLSERTGLSTTHINDVENGLKEPGIRVLVLLAKALKVPITDLYKVIWQNQRGRYFLREYKIREEFKKSEQEYRNFKKINKRLPTAQEWNRLARTNRLLSSVSMRFIGNIRFKRETTLD